MHNVFSICIFCFYQTQHYCCCKVDQKLHSETFELLLAEFVLATSVLYFDDVSSEKLEAVISIGGGGTLTNTLGIKKFL